MSTVLNENNLPCHIQIKKANSYGKIWLHPHIEINYSINFTNVKGKAIVSIVNKNHNLLN